MRKLLVSLLFVVCAFGLGCGDDDDGGGQAAANIDTSLPGDPDRGEAVYQRVCLACHAADGRGNGGLTGGNFIDQPERLQQDNAVLIGRITNGILDKTPPMPAQGGILSEQEIKDALSYVRREFGGTRE
jgi:mono/diheme cytochrome c family protein